jgi:hypothetical protein
MNLNATRWVIYTLYSIRSIACIVISTCRNIYDSKHSDQLIQLPPDEHIIENLE